MSEARGVVVASQARLRIRTSADIPDAVNACIGADGLILTDDDLPREFFDLGSGLAGELLQKLVNYNVRTAIILRDWEAYGQRFAELVPEHRSHPVIRIVGSREEANAWLEFY